MGAPTLSSVTRCRRFRPPAYFGYFLSISWRNPHSVCRQQVASGRHWEDETNAPKKHLAMQRDSHVARLFARQLY